MSEPIRRRSLRDLLGAVDIVACRGSIDVAAGAIRSDSRAVEPGDVFVCLPGYRSEGGEVRADRHEFISQAIARGAAALVVERETAANIPPTVAVVRVADCWTAVAELACASCDHPSRRMIVVGVTGTSGKTSTTYFIDAVLMAAGHRTARFGTVEYKLGEAVRDATQTTPEAPELQRLLCESRDAGLTAVVMEVSSHALELRRVHGIAYDVAVFTNLSQDHLNFHPDMHHYLRAKGRLFQELGSGGKDAVAVVNDDDPSAAYVRRVNQGRLLTYSVRAPADVAAERIKLTRRGVHFLMRTPAGATEVRLRHLGDYNVHNALAAAGTGLALGLPLDVIRDGLEATPPVPGRFELVDCGQDFLVIVDYAHKPGALARVIESARGLQPGRLITVFGCGGNRDRSKRPQMGAIAAGGSDRVVVTSDNPRSEDPASIINEIVAGIPPEARARVDVEPDRARAIAQALHLAGRGDLVLIAGKGHETYQLLGPRRVHFDDREVVREVLGAMRASRRI